MNKEIIPIEIEEGHHIFPAEESDIPNIKLEQLKDGVIVNKYRGFLGKDGTNALVDDQNIFYVDILDEPKDKMLVKIGKDGNTWFEVQASNEELNEYHIVRYTVAMLHRHIKSKRLER
ncbi:MAG: hypothetical protein WCP03_02155 [Candidatus Saccharibacteria bacterium]